MGLYVISNIFLYGENEWDFYCALALDFIIIVPVEIQNQTTIFIILELLSSFAVLLKSSLNQMSNENVFEYAVSLSNVSVLSTARNRK